MKFANEKGEDGGRKPPHPAPSKAAAIRSAHRVTPTPIPRPPRTEPARETWEGIRMTRFDYLIIGGGQVADEAAKGIRELDEKGTIGILSADSDAPYTRPALSKKLWVDPEFSYEDIDLGTAETGAEIILDTLVTDIDREKQKVVTKGGERYGYGKLLIATGSEPREIPAPDDERVIFFRSAADYRKLRELTKDGVRIVVIGGGYIGSEIAAALAQNGARVQYVYPAEVLGDQRFPANIALEYQGLFVDGGVELLGGRRAERVREGDDGALLVNLDDGETLEADAVVVGLGAEPVLDLAERAGLTVDEGVEVDKNLQTSDPHIWAAGDIASYPDEILGRSRIEHVDNAQEMGRQAGKAMAGDESGYTHTPYFYSQVFGARWEAVGTLDPSLETLEVDLDEGKKVVYYLDDGKPVGVLLWKVEDATDAAREVLRKQPTDKDELRQSIR